MIEKSFYKGRTYLKQECSSEITYQDLVDFVKEVKGEIEQVQILSETYWDYTRIVLCFERASTEQEIAEQKEKEAKQASYAIAHKRETLARLKKELGEV